MNAYSYNGLENYCYPNTDILVNKREISWFDKIIGQSY